MARNRKTWAAPVVVALVVLLAIAVGGGTFAYFRRPHVERDFPGAVRDYLAHAKWKSRGEALHLDRKTLEASLAKAQDFLVANQKPDGNFNYEYDWVAKKMTEGDNQVRQAGALWSLALLYQHAPSDATRQAVERGLAFFFKATVPGKQPGMLLVAYRNDAQTSTGTVALLGLTMVDYLHANPPMEPARRQELEEKLDGYLKYLAWMQNADGHFASKYKLAAREKIKTRSPYYDGETLLCLTKAAKYLNRTDLRPAIEKAAPVLARDYALPIWNDPKNAQETKQFYQWGSMAFWEYQDAGWPNGGFLGDVLLVMAHWLVHTHKVAARAFNTGYAVEGLAHAYHLADKRGDKAAADDMRWAIDTVFNRLLAWQVGGPLASKDPFLVDHPTTDPLALGGFQNGKDKPPLRIDVTQHTAHAIVLGLRYIYGGDQAAGGT